MTSADLDALDRMVTDDVVIIRGNGRVVSGRTALRSDIESSLASLRLEQTTRHEETIVAGDWALDRARLVTRR
jgi:ketosteroid isomerase-like protein